MLTDKIFNLIFIYLDLSFPLSMNQNPEQLARDQIDTALLRCGWLIQDKTKINLNAGLGIALREYQTDTRNKKFFELNNHLGNTLLTVADKKLGHDQGNGSIDYYKASVITASHYTPW
jgi:hypothetical protein